MKKQILFVDDEINILKGLKRTLRPMREQWEMTFAEGAASALDILKQREFDVIVTDMRMPQMDGSKLLRIVRDEYPKIVRIILSGHSDQEMIMKSVKTAHQYLSKPCEKEVLIDAILRSFSLREKLSRSQLLELLGGIETMPSLPGLYTNVMDVLQSADASAQAVGDIIAQDMGMTAKILQLVNSSFFGIPTHIASAREAVKMLGLDVVKNLVLGIEVFSSISQNAASDFPVDAISRHCVKSGGIAKEIAQAQKMDHEMVDNAVIAAILHDIGKLILIEHFSDEYKQAIAVSKDEKIPIFQAEKKVFDVSHAEVGAYLLGLWGLPDNVVEAIAYHHDPCANPSDLFDVCGVVHVAELMEYHEQVQPGTWEQLTGMDMTYMQQHGMTDRVMVWRDQIRCRSAG